MIMMIIMTMTIMMILSNAKLLIEPGQGCERTFYLLFRYFPACLLPCS